MNSLRYGNMLAALELTRSGKLGEATSLLRNSLRGRQAPAGNATSSDDNGNDESIVASSAVINVTAARPIRRCTVAKSVRRAVGESIPRTAGESIPRTVGESIPRTVGESIPRAAGESIPRTVGESSPRTVGESGPRAVSESSPRTVGESSPRAVSESIPRTVGESSPRVVGESSPPTVGESNPRTVGEFLSLSYKSAIGARAYKLYIPSGYDGRACPLVVMLHGCTQSADDFAIGTRMNAIADERLCLIAYPEQPSSANSSKCWNWFVPRNQQRGLGEPALIAGLTRHIMQEYAVDPKRVYVAGLSAGGAAAAVLGETYGDVYAAVGIHSGIACGQAHNVATAFAVMRTGENAGRRYKRAPVALIQPIPTIVFHGDRDSTVHPSNANHFISDRVTVDSEKRVNVSDGSTGRKYTRTSFHDASGQEIFENWTIHGSGHAWSGGSATGSYTDPHGPDASREMMRFFLQHELNQPISQAVAQ